MTRMDLINAFTRYSEEYEEDFNPDYLANFLIVEGVVSVDSEVNES